MTEAVLDKDSKEFLKIYREMLPVNRLNTLINAKSTLTIQRNTEAALRREYGVPEPSTEQTVANQRSA
jgi:phenylalanyl-tRNA synthetase beta subunit